jgi:hypothetical protein
MINVQKRVFEGMERVAGVDEKGFFFFFFFFVGTSSIFDRSKTKQKKL